MKMYQRRLLSERNELKERIEKLSKFIESSKYDELSNDQKDLMKVQIVAMKQYFDILDKRINLEDMSGDFIMSEIDENKEKLIRIQKFIIDVVNE